MDQSGDAPDPLAPPSTVDPCTAAVASPATATTATPGAIQHVSQYDVLLVLGRDGAELPPQRVGSGAVAAAAGEKFDFYVAPTSAPMLNAAATNAQPPPPPQPPPPQTHVGNNRCAVFCQMNLTDFVRAATADAQTAVLDTVYDIVARQCVDAACARAGKFLLLKPDRPDRGDGPVAGGTAATTSRSAARDPARWTELSRRQARAFLRRHCEREQRDAAAIFAPPAPTLPAAATEDETTKRRRRSSLLRRSMSGGDVFADQKKRAALRQSIYQQMQKFDTSSSVDDDDDESEAEDDDPRDDTEDDDKDDVDGDSNAAADEGPVIVPASTAVSPEAAMPPFFRRTSSGSGRRRPILERSPSWTEGTATSKNTVIHTANALDVIVQAAAGVAAFYRLVPNHTGNNRVLVMVQLRLARYTELARASKASSATTLVHQLCAELVNAVQSNYHGRFLVEHDPGGGDNKECYLLLTEEQAAAALECIFRCEAAAEAAAAEAVVVEVASLPTGCSTTPGGEKTYGSDVPVVTLPLEKNEQRPSLIKAQTLQQLRHIPTAFGGFDSGDVHRAAIEALQKRKKRQGVNSKISQMVAINTTHPTPLLLDRSRYPSTGRGGGGGGEDANRNYAQSPTISSPSEFTNHRARYGSTASLPAAESSGLARHPASSLHSRYGSAGGLSTPQSIGLERPSANYTRYSSTGGIPNNGVEQQSTYQPMTRSAERGMQQSPEYLQQAAMGDIHGWNEARPFDVVSTDSPLQHPFQQGRRQSRRSTLSQFSQSMIQDMLLRLEVNKDFHGDSGHGDCFSDSVMPVAIAAGTHPGDNAAYQAIDDGSDFPVSAEAAAAALALGFGRDDTS